MRRSMEDFGQLVQVSCRIGRHLNVQVHNRLAGEFTGANSADSAS